MVYKIVDNKYQVLIESLLVTLIIFIVGFSIGFFVEFYRTSKVVDSYKEFEIEALDLKLQNYYYQIMDRSSCEEAIKQNFAFADDIYNNGLILEKYEEANQVTNDIFIEKKRYVLLKTELWLNSILLKDKCNEPFDTIVYLYSGDPQNNLILSQQKIISNTLKEIKEEKGNSVILLPIAGDLKLESVELQMRIFNVTYLPSILINEELVLEGFHEAEEIKSYLRY